MIPCATVDDLQDSLRKKLLKAQLMIKPLWDVLRPKVWERKVFLQEPQTLSATDSSRKKYHRVPTAQLWARSTVRTHPSVSKNQISNLGASEKVTCCRVTNKNLVSRATHLGITLDRHPIDGINLGYREFLSSQKKLGIFERCSRRP